MEKYFGNAYRGDPGVPHSDPRTFWGIWLGAIGFSAFTWHNPYMWQSPPTEMNFHDRAMLFEQYHWKKARAKNKEYEFEWNKRPKWARENYYFNWPDYYK